MTPVEISSRRPTPFPSSSTNFEGPLDLLLHLIKKNEVNIHDIPIALITAQYLDAIELMQELNLDVAGEFLVMAATLIHIKSKMLLPRPETAGRRRRRRGGSARRAGAAAARAPEIQGGRGPAARARAGARRAVAAARRAGRRDCRRRLRAGARGRSLQPAHARFRRSCSARSSGRRCCCRPSRSRWRVRIEQLLAAAVGNRGLRLRGSVRRRAAIAAA